MTCLVIEDFSLSFHFSFLVPHSFISCLADNNLSTACQDAFFVVVVVSAGAIFHDQSCTFHKFILLPLTFNFSNIPWAEEHLSIALKSVGNNWALVADTAFAPDHIKLLPIHLLISEDTNVLGGTFLKYSVLPHSILVECAGEFAHILAALLIDDSSLNHSTFIEDAFEHSLIIWGIVGAFRQG